MTEREPGWRASLDGVVSDFDVVTAHLRRRQRQALRVAWSVVVATGVCLGGVIALNLAPAGYPSAPVSSSPPLAAFAPAPSALLPGGGLGAFDLPPTGDASPPATGPAAPPSGGTSPAATPRLARHRLQVTTPTVPATPAVPADPVTAVAPPPDAAPSAPPPASAGLVDTLVGGVLHLVG